MPDYRRNRVPGGTFFFTVNLLDRRPDLLVTHVEALRAAHIINQDGMLRPTFGSPKWYRSCGSHFTCGSPMENDANTDWFKSGPNIPLARQLLAEGGYDGRPVVLLQATSQLYMMNGATVLAQEMRSAGMKADLQPMDWANVVARRTSQNPPDQGGFVPMANGIRAAGLVEIAPIDDPPDPSRPEVIRFHAKRALPGLDFTGATTWTGQLGALGHHRSYHCRPDRRTDAASGSRSLRPHPVPLTS